MKEVHVRIVKSRHDKRIAVIDHARRFISAGIIVLLCERDGIVA